VDGVGEIVAPSLSHQPSAFFGTRAGLFNEEWSGDTQNELRPICNYDLPVL
jgi:hypothetical protein